jgi:hypothetical protein
MTISPVRRTSSARVVAGVAESLARLNDLTLDELRAEWRRLYRSAPPRLSRDLMRRAIAYRIQEKALGGLSPANKRKLKEHAIQIEITGRVMPDSRPVVRSGARLVREWNGRTYTVTVTEDGFEYGGKLYRSLTKVARVITSAHWSGPRFFGLNGAMTRDTPNDPRDD